MEKIFSTSEEKYLRTTIFYADSNSKLFKDKAWSIGATKEEVENAFMKGLLVVIFDDDFYRPTVMYNDGDYATVQLVTIETSGESSTAAWKAFYSTEKE